MTEKAEKKLSTAERARRGSVRVLSLRGILSEPLEVYSKLAAEFAYRIVLCPATRSIVSQPFTLKCTATKSKQPDFAVMTTLGKCVAIKLFHERVTPDATLSSSMSAELGERNARLMMLTALDIHRDATHDRASQILRYSKASYSAADQARTIEVVSNNPGIAMGDLTAEARCRNELVFHLLSRRLLSVGRHLPIDVDAPVSLPETTEVNDEESIAKWMDVALWR